ncbi:MAG: hypothetical protein LBD29_03950 [Treponema sp.]|jgi:hypothetical protein|nr:hypothetical protein [Treponema sp.]
MNDQISQLETADAELKRRAVEQENWGKKQREIKEGLLHEIDRNLSEREKAYK